MKKEKLIATIVICSMVLYPTTITVASAERKSDKKTESKTPIEKFIELYNENADENKNEKIEDTIPADLQGSDYKTEFRLSAFEDAIGNKGEIGDSEILIINYGTFNLDSLRIYVAPETGCDVNSLARNIIHTLDSSITDQEIDEQLSKASLYLGDTGYITGYVTNDDVMIDCTKLNFN